MSALIYDRLCLCFEVWSNGAGIVLVSVWTVVDNLCRVGVIVHVHIIVCVCRNRPRTHHSVCVVIVDVHIIMCVCRNDIIVCAFVSTKICQLLTFALTPTRVLSVFDLSGQVD